MCGLPQSFIRLLCANETIFWATVPSLLCYNGPLHCANICSKIKLIFITMLMADLSFGVNSSLVKDK